MLTKNFSPLEQFETYNLFFIPNPFSYLPPLISGIEGFGSNILIAEFWQNLFTITTLVSFLIFLFFIFMSMLSRRF